MEQLRLETLFLGLRIKNAVHLEELKNQYDCDLIIEKKRRFDKLRGEGFVSIQDGNLSPTPTGLAVTDSLSLI